MDAGVDVDGLKDECALTGQVALVTGASRGLGRALAIRMHGEGMHVAVIARTAEGLETLANELRSAGGLGEVITFSGDVTVPDSVASIVSEVERELGGIDLLVNNAGLAESQDVAIWEGAPDEWWQVVTTNLRGPALLCRFALPAMVAQGRGRIVNINSLRGVRAQATQSAYAVSKGALALLTRNLATSLDGTEVRVFDYSPGRVQTDLARSLVALGSMSDSGWTPTDQATNGVLAIASGRLDVLSGHFLHAHDDLEDLAQRAKQIVRAGGRQVELSEAFPGDPLRKRQVGRET